MRARFKSVKSKIILLFVLLAVFQICVMAGFAKFHLTPKIVSMYSEHLDRFSDTILGETVSEKEKIETYMVNIIGDSLIQRYLDAESRQAEETPDMPESSELRNRILSYTDYDNSITAIYLTDNYGNIYSNGSQTEMTSFLKRHPELAYRKDASAVWYTEDRTGDIKVICLPEVYKVSSDLLKNDAVVKIKGRARLDSENKDRYMIFARSVVYASSRRKQVLIPADGEYPLFKGANSGYRVIILDRRTGQLIPTDFFIEEEELKNYEHAFVRNFLPGIPFGANI